MNTAWLCITVLGCFMAKSTDADLGTEWTTPVIADGIDGSGTIEPALRDDATEFPQLVADGATNYVLDSQNPEGIFVITAATGQLALAADKKLDYETNPKHALVVKVDDGGLTTTTGTATITINIVDVNDNPPVFTESTYSACVLEHTSIGDTVLTVSTTDADGTTGVNVISEMIFTDGDTNGDFSINPIGEITLVKALDMAKYTLTVEAADSDTGTNKLTGTTTVSVTIAEKCSGVGILAASLLTMMVGVMTSLSSLQC